MPSVSYGFQRFGPRLGRKEVGGQISLADRGSSGIALSAQRNFSTHSISIFAAKKAEQGHGDNLQIEGQTPIAQVIKIVFNPFRDRSIAPPSVHLGPSGDPGFEHMAGVVAINFLQEPLHEKGALRARSHDTHVSLQDVQELRQLVEIGPSQEGSYFGAPRIMVAGPMRVFFFPAAHLHSAEFEHRGKPAHSVPRDPEQKTLARGWPTLLPKR